MPFVVKGIMVARPFPNSSTHLFDQLKEESRSGQVPLVVLIEGMAIANIPQP